MLNFQKATSEMTLKEGLSEYYGTQSGLISGRGISETAREFFRCHDTAHVVFGCSTTLTNEAVVKMWSFFGTTSGLRLLQDYRSPESKEIYQTISWREIPRTVWRSARSIPLVIIRCGRMKKRWPWHDFDDYLNTGLVDIRREFGIKIVSIP